MIPMDVESKINKFIEDELSNVDDQTIKKGLQNVLTDYQMEEIAEEAKKRGGGLEMPDFTEEEQELVEEFRKLDQEQQEELITNLGLQKVKNTMQILFPDEIEA